MTVPPQSVTRRRVTTGLAWSAPAVAAAVAAPLAAATPCVTTTFSDSWTSANYSRVTTTTSVYQAPDPDGAGPASGVRIDISASYGSNLKAGKAVGSDNWNLQASTNGTQGGTYTEYLAFHQAPLVSRYSNGGLYDDEGWDFTTASMGTATQQRNTAAYTFTFDRPVDNLSFTILDIDSNGGNSTNQDFWDIVWLSAVNASSPVSYSQTKANSTHLLGDGSFSNPWRARNSNSPVDPTSAVGNVTVRFAQPVTKFTVYYGHGLRKRNGSADPDQNIFISNLSFTHSVCR
ncbi:hypothetical protein [Micrococcus luteus]|uniref:hypothetical protein n=1 Tax=Micrococcus luteus TaxID=1270 RepID=UPI00385BE039